MMPASKFHSFLFACVLLPQVAFANPHVDAVVAELQSRGYERIEISRTLLGRYRVVGTTETAGREIVVYGGTGAVVRDYRYDIDNESEDDSGNDDADWDNAETDPSELTPDESGWFEDQLGSKFPSQNFDDGSDGVFSDQYDVDDDDHGADDDSGYDSGTSDESDDW